jgi:probable HAF family extracellular repeat protein
MYVSNLARQFAIAATLAFATLFATDAQADRARHYSVETLPDLAGLGSSPRTMNNRGDVAGTAIVAGFPNLNQHAVIWRRGRVTDIGAGLELSLVTSMNDEGTMVGQVGVQPYMWNREGVATKLPFAGRVNRITKDGTIVGTWFASGVFNFGPDRAMFFRDGVLHDLGFPAPAFRTSTAADMNEHGIVVGSAIPNFTSDNHAVLWKDGVMRDLGGLGGHNAFAAFINDRGDIVGTAETADQRVMMVRWNVEGGMQVLGENLSPHAMNQRGQIVGNNRNGQPFVWDDGVVTNLLDASGLRARGITNFAPFAINDRGQITGIAFTGGFFSATALVLTPN